MAEVGKLHKSMSKDKGLQKTLQRKDNELGEIQQNMAKWKEETATKLAKKFREELAREIEKYLNFHVYHMPSFIHSLYTRAVLPYITGL